MANRSTYLCICLSILSICLQSNPLLANTPISIPTSQPSKSSIDYHYPEYARAAVKKLMELKNKYPNLKIYPAKLLEQRYPYGMICSTVKQTPLITYLVFGIPENKEVDILGENDSAQIEGAVFGNKDTSENRKLSAIAFERSIQEAYIADRNRPVADKDKQVLYQFRVQFDPASCKK